ncbi:hypothetical protein [Marinoscillum furvescens]|uniref:Glycosyl transferase family 2 n=1 Tax=Marinoscillum furvescens DSM 4134 TaxID=1122208 RepID=A0A3D9KY60_MARFU|nr:hypothetical protein [Marinoscillum furvescens]RED92302.1 hypothetical protein C7460_13116 [Marinoscillum furvescens DSM 4134]
MTTSKPKLSIVLCGRNDTYGDDFLNRLETSLAWNAQKAEQHKVTTELIMVEYHPLPDKENLTSLSIWPRNPFWSTRIITVPGDANEFREFPAKNIGIRRATGDYILASNADMLFPDAFFQFANSLSDESAIYRADRLNIHRRTNAEDEMLTTTSEYCVQGGMYHRPAWISHELYYPLLKAYLPLRRLLYKTLKLRTASERFLLNHHFVAAGDFTLAHQSVWHALDGYWEDSIISTHVDSLFLLKAIGSGYEVKNVDFPTMHQHHDRRHDFSNQSPEMKLMWTILHREIEQYLNQNALNPLSTPNWGNPKENYATTDL